MKTTKVALSFLLLASPLYATAWEGTETESGNDVEIEKGNLVRTGETIEYFDNNDGEYKSVTIDDINRYGDTVEIEATDDDTGESVTLEMEDE